MKNFEKFKKAIIKDKIKDKDNSDYSNAFAFAIKNDIFPICDLYFYALSEYENNFKINKQTISDIYIDLQNHYDNNKKISFNNLNYTIGDTYSSNGDKLIDICRYFFLSKKFDKDFWNIFLYTESHSLEVYSIDNDFLIDELRY